VLVAEDNLVNQLIIRELLLSAGAQVEVVGDGAAAVSRWEEWPCDVVILDCMMPGMDGYDACVQIRARQGVGERVPIFAMTAATLPEDLERCREAGMDRVLTKPARLDGLIQALRETIPPRVASRTVGQGPRLGA
jgi:two-component system sensor histidine kinase EvgS